MKNSSRAFLTGVTESKSPKIVQMYMYMYCIPTIFMKRCFKSDFLDLLYACDILLLHWIRLNRQQHYPIAIAQWYELYDFL